MNIEQFTIKSQEALQKAQEIAQSRRQQQIENAHLLKAMLESDKDVIPFLLKKNGIEPSVVEKSIDRQVEGFPRVNGDTASMYLSNAAQKTIQKALSILPEWKDDFVSLEHLLYGMLSANDETCKTLKNMGLTEKGLKAAIQELRKGSRVDSPNAEQQYQALNRYARNLNDLARKGKLDPVIGRDEEIRRVLQILCRRTKNNPILIGEPGVGKTAIAEGLAHRIVEGDVPENLKTKQVYSLDMGALVAGAKYKGEFEERLKSVVKEVTAGDGEIILFIDEIHTLVGAGGEGAMDAANILKPALARGELRAIGATTTSEYQKYFEKDKALERRFQVVYVDEPDRLSTVSILRGLKERYEKHHQVKILDEALVAAVDLSQRYITERFLPDKAIDLIDEAASKLRLEINSVPQPLDDIERKMRQLEIEREAIRREDDQEKVARLSEQISELGEKRNSMRARWEQEKQCLNQIQEYKNEIEEAKFQASQEERNGNYGKVAELRYGKIKELENSLKEATENLQALQGEAPMIDQEVGADDIAAVVARWTGIPVQRMMQSEKEKLLHLEAELHKRVIGQEEAISAIADAIRRSRAGLQDSKRPIGSFLFLGTTGVGKTELAKALAEYLFNTEDAMVRIDMSEYQEAYSVSRLVGAPPGYIGYDEGGQLTEKVRRKPYSVVLFDEIEKAHPDVFNILLQVLDDGRLTDNKGRVADFKNTIIIMTSNLGSSIIQEHFQQANIVDESVTEGAKEEVMGLLRKTIRPEFLNRIDEILMFKPLNKKEIQEIVKLQLQQVERLLEQNDLHITLTDYALEALTNLGYNPQYGARPLKRVIQKHILNNLSKMILADKLTPETTITVDYIDEDFVFYQKS
ncbi:MAG: ATP-dependent chaperone ClpB [Bacteroidales bacterium]|nr:ATP-dependent chaperone ClpB [Bacteroidales bacterium]